MITCTSGSYSARKWMTLMSKTSQVWSITVDGHGLFLLYALPAVHLTHQKRDHFFNVNIELRHMVGKLFLIILLNSILVLSR